METFFEDIVPPALTTGMLKSLVTICFDQANRRMVKVSKQHHLFSSHGQLDLEWLWVNVLTDRAGAVLVGGVCTLTVLPTTK